MSSLPRLLGLGLDAQHSHRYPGGMRGLCERFRERLSHVSVVSIRGREQAKRFVDECSRGLPTIHHLSGVAPGDVDGPHLEKMTLVNETSHSLGSLWTCEDLGAWSIGPYAMPYFAPPLFEADVATLLAERVASVDRASVIPFLPEVPSCSLVAGNLGLGEFFEQVTRQSDCNFVLDVSHVYSYAIASKKNAGDVLRTLPLERAWEVHIAGGRLSKDAPLRYIDSHSDTVLDEVMSLFEDTLALCKNLRCVTYEIGMRLQLEMIELDFARIEGALRSSRF